MDIFTRKNALVGYIALAALKRKMRRKRKTRRALAIGLGVVSLGALAAIAALLVKRQHAGESGAVESDDEIVGEVVTAASEPIPAT